MLKSKKISKKEGGDSEQKIIFIYRFNPLKPYDLAEVPENKMVIVQESPSSYLKSRKKHKLPKKSNPKKASLFPRKSFYRLTISGSLQQFGKFESKEKAIQKAKILIKNNYAQTMILDEK